MFKFLLRTFFFLILASFIAAGYFYYEVSKTGPLQSDSTIIIEKGATLSKIANELYAKGMIDNVLFFRILGKVTKVSDKVKVGEYNIEAKSSAIDILNLLVSGKNVIHRLSIPEGYRVEEIVAILNSIDILGGEQIDSSNIAEGSLLPETYYYSYGDKREDILKRMTSSMSSELDRLWENRYPRLPLKSKEEALILASIVEKETGIAAERDVVASVFINRLNKGMRLQSDPTVIYAFNLERKLYKKDLEKPHPYNTYRVGGLPPGPICNPGIDSIKAVLNPAETTYLYFVANGTGGHSFASSLKEHNKNVTHWRSLNK